MEIEQVKKLKKEVEDKIREALSSFEIETGLRIDSISLENHSIDCEFGNDEFRILKIEVKL